MKTIDQQITDDYAIYHADTVEIAKSLPDDSVHFSVFSPPFETLYTYYQAIRRQWRFGQSRDVIVHIVSADTEGAVIENIRRKDRQHEEMAAAMMDHMRDLMHHNVIGAQIERTDYLPSHEVVIPEWLVSR